jgi:type VI secretion system protein ImpH
LACAVASRAELSVAAEPGDFARLSSPSVQSYSASEGCLLGRGFYDRANTVRVVTTPHTHEAVLGLMPGRGNHRELMALLRFYLGYEARAHLEMHVSPDLMPAQQLNSAQVSLGFTTQLPPSRTGAAAATVTRVQLGAWTGGSERDIRERSTAH